MSEITKLYENAGIEPRRKCEFYEDCPLGFAHSCDDCDIEFRESNSSYPPFTSGKQLELIKWLGKNKNGFGFLIMTQKGSSCHCDFNSEWFEKDFYAEDFDNALAGLINSLWRDLTEEEKQQVKGILE